ncbi:hypothetical protein ACFT2C_12595 [Promicromonospora sp. NPDC057138]|uniref:hypothetical protein n=1 Tax=Promicromonospora sp. NPDC057138 TaxID=3346031 RepID=UPI0036288A46
MADVSNRSRRPQGAPDSTGGQFSTEDHAEVAVVLDTAPGPETVTEVVGYSRTEISTAAHALRNLLSEQSAARTGSDELFNHESRSAAFSEYVAILHDPEVLDDPWTDIAVGQSAANTRDALRAGFDMSAPSGLNETQRRAAIEYISGRFASELAYAAEADAQPKEAPSETRAEDHHSRGRLEGYGAALVELVHSGQQSSTRVETNSKLAEMTDTWKEPPAPYDVIAVAIRQRTAHRTAVAEQEAAAAHDDVIGARQDLTEANRQLDLAFAADPNWDHHSALENDISDAHVAYREAERAHDEAIQKLCLARAPQLLREVDEDLGNAPP